MRLVLITLPELELARSLAGVLRSRGYQVLVAAAAEHGVRLAEQMRLGPGGHGRGAASRCRPRAPGMDSAAAAASASSSARVHAPSPHQS